MDNLDSGVMIETKNLTKKFNGLIAVNHVSFNVKRGEVFGLLGPNGAGSAYRIWSRHDGNRGTGIQESHDQVEDFFPHYHFINVCICDLEVINRKEGYRCSYLSSWFANCF